MILPKGDVVHENLRTAYVELNSFIQTLKDDNFTGYVQISFWEYEGVLFMEAGEIVNAIEEAQGTRMGGEEAVENILLQSKQKDGRIDVFKLVPEMVTILASTTMKEATYKDLSTEFTSLDKLLEKLSKENHSGYLDIMLNNNQGRGLIFFQEGEVAEVVMSDDKSGEIYGKDKLDKIINDVQNLGATFNVYRAKLGDGSERAGISQSIDLHGVTEIFQEIMSTIEAVVDKLGKRSGVFMDNLKTAQVEKSDVYPFLDPFAAEFEYMQGKIKFHGKVSAEVLASGIKDCIEMTLNKIPIKITKDELYEKIRSSLQPTIKKFEKKIDDFGLKSIISEFLGS
jgi:hypothetical protein